MGPPGRPGPPVRLCYPDPMRPRHLALLALLVVLFGAGFLAGKSPATSELPYKELDTFIEILDKVQHDYVDPVEPKKLIAGAIDGMMKRLDPFSEYLDQAEYADLKSITEGQFGGLGIVISIRDNYPTVISPVEGTPAYSLGIQSGDVIVKIDGASTRGFTAEDAVKKLRGPEGSPVTITVARVGEAERDVKITRQIIHVKSVPYAFEVAPAIGYLRVSTFSETTGDEVRLAVARLTKAGARSVIVDLRDNPGGLLSQAVDVAESFVPKGSLIVFTKGRAPGSNEKVFATVDRAVDTHPMVVLVNGGSASASEIVAGAIQDLDRGLVVGTTSFGKGSVQSLIELKGRGTAIKLTTGRYYTPSGRSIHRDAWNHLSHDDDTAALDDTTDFGSGAGAPAPSDTTRRPEFKTRSGRIVYGGGGITPDVVVPADTLAPVSREVERRGLFFEFASRYAAAHKGERAPTAIAPATWTEFTQLLADKKVEAKPQALAAERGYLERGMRRELARRLDGVTGDEDAFKVAIERDPQLARAINLLGRAHNSDELFKLATR
jgi:carboxyl-terminal processing protease